MSAAETAFQQVHTLYSDHHGWVQSLAVVSLMARYAFTPKLSLQINVENLFNRKYYNNIDGQAYVGTPRNVSATLNYKF